MYMQIELRALLMMFVTAVQNLFKKHDMSLWEEA